MRKTWVSVRRRVKQIVAGGLFVGLLIGASGTVFTVFAEAISHLGSTPSSLSVVTTPIQELPPVTGGTQSTQSTPDASVPSGSDAPYQPPVMEYPNSNPSSGVDSTADTPSDDSPNPDEDGVNSALAAAMATGGVYLGEHLQSAFGSMLKGVLDTLFINTN
ncbi:hypothetical protein NZD89_10545 [Alicyclobacillus fastidiosus]|uniref:Uncharacterized protein n=1 Tax=Alicyclobacillus fastidiosus TaxID=392011 RepID=A0ABY6ZLI6_9BACL|nr:hypothetical protein [Alicyclobacillus fastidiosus]WAH43778.1 hypothetical protein NZD89_10545 [Alicyclobacillus fastidiosus]